MSCGKHVCEVCNPRYCIECEVKLRPGHDGSFCSDYCRTTNTAGVLRGLSYDLEYGETARERNAALRAAVQFLLEREEGRL